MAYMRGERYVWTDTEDWLHIWCRDGYDEWDNAGWAVDGNGQRQEGYENASGTSLPMSVMDEYVVMRIAEMIEEGSAAAAIDRAARSHGNFGGADLEANADLLKGAFAALQLKMVDHATAVRWLIDGKPEGA